jgi:hypothetical protein
VNSSQTPPGDRVPSPLRRWIPEILFLLITTAAGLWAQGRWLDPTGDPGIWWSLLGRLARGERYYRDVFLQYGPLSPYLLSIAGRLWNFSAAFFLIANWIPAVAAGVLLIRAGRPFLSNLERLSLAGFILSVGVFAPAPARLVLPYCPGAVHAICFSLGALLLLQSPDVRSWRGWGGGLLAGLAFCAKQEIGVAALLGLCAAAWTRRPRAASWAVACLAGFSLVALVGGLFALASAPVASLQGESHLWPFAAVPATPWKALFRIVAGVSGPQWARPALEAAQGLAGLAVLLAMAGLLLSRQWRLRRWLACAGILLALMLVRVLDGSPLVPDVHVLSLSMTVAFLVVLLALRDRGRAGRQFLIGFGCFAGLVGARTAFSVEVGGPFSGVSHLSTALTWAVFLFCFVPVLLPGGTAAAVTRRLWVTVLLPVSCYAAGIGIEHLAASDRVPVSTARGHVWVEPRLAPFFQLLSAQLRPGERALILPETNAVDILYGVQSVSPFLIHMPGWLDANAEQKLLVQFERNPPDVVVLFERGASEFRVRPFGRGFGVHLSAWIDQRYRVVQSTSVGKILRK